MRIVTWNVNGIKTLIQYHPWNIKRTHEGIMEDLGGDIICIQETKITRAQLEKSMACMNAYDAFYSFYRRSVKGIHGTAIFTKRDVVVPVKAEEGIGSSLVPSTTAARERIGGYPLSSEADLDWNAMKDLDSEGRTTVVDCGMFVLINLYCPNETNSDRLVFKNNFNTMVDKRVRGLIKAGREVIVVGDLNICASDLDTAEPDQRARDRGLEHFTDHPPRKWLGEFTDHGGKDGVMIDITRYLHPERHGMYTCWNTKIDARPSNFGTRLDYILITPGLLPWVKHSDIQRDIVGSDHCPVYLDFHDELDIPGRGKVSIWDELNPGRKQGDTLPDPPHFAARFLNEFSGKQKLLSSFFGKKAEVSPAAPSPSPSPNPQPSSAPEASTSASSSRSSSSNAFSASQPLAAKPSTSSTSSGKKGKGKEREKSPAEEKEDKKPGQQSLATFFKPPPKPEPLSKKKRTKRKTDSPPPADSPIPSTASRSRSSSSQPKVPSSFLKPPEAAAEDSDDDILIIEHPTDSSSLTKSSPSSSSQLQSQSQHPPASPSSLSSACDGTAMLNAEASSTWSSIFASKPPPLCEGHNEPSKLWTVNKTGINKGRRFFLCSRPVGPGYDQGQAKLHVDPQWRCNFFQWETSVKRPAGIALDSAAKKRKS
ncbi:hypothetical protein JCM11641_002946 [Rhodosporidiobolus odoratus]